jgi:hypothetical protein
MIYGGIDMKGKFQNQTHLMNLGTLNKLKKQWNGNKSSLKMIWMDNKE